MNFSQNNIINNNNNNNNNNNDSNNSDNKDHDSYNNSSNNNVKDKVSSIRHYCKVNSVIIIRIPLFTKDKHIKFCIK